MAGTQPKSVIFEGDKNNFSSKGAIDRLKKDLKNDDKEKLEKNDYFKDGWTYKILSNNDTEMKVKIIEKTVPNKSEENEKRNMLKMKLKQMRQNRCSQSQLKMKMKMNDNISDDLASLYLHLKSKVNVPIPDPSLVLENPGEYREVIYTMLKSFGPTFATSRNPVIQYFKLLAEKIGIPINYIPPPNQQLPSTQNNPENNNSFINQLRSQRDNQLNMEVDEELKKIYESLEIDNSSINV